jgi:hypothetical protein
MNRSTSDLARSRTVDLHGRTERPSSVLVEQHLASGFHSVVLRPAQGIIPCDC